MNGISLPFSSLKRMVEFAGSVILDASTNSSKYNVIFCHVSLQLCKKERVFLLISKIDLSMGFFTFGLDPNAKKLWAISIPFGLYQYLCLPLGLTNRPDIFQSVMHPLFQDMPEVEGFIDAICIFRSGSFKITSKFYPKFFSSGGKGVNSLSTPQMFLGCHLHRLFGLSYYCSGHQTNSIQNWGN